MDVSIDERLELSVAFSDDFAGIGHGISKLMQAKVLAIRLILFLSELLMKSILIFI